MSVGMRLKEERQRLGLSQAEFAALAGATKGAQLKWEKNEAAPNAAALVGFGAGGADIYYILTGERLDRETSSRARDLIALSSQLRDGYDFEALEAELSRLKSKPGRNEFDDAMLETYRQFLSGIATKEYWPSSSRAGADQLLIAHFGDASAKERSASRFRRVSDQYRAVKHEIDTYIDENSIKLPQVLYHAIVTIVSTYKVDENHIAPLLEGLREMSCRNMDG